jgi:hypothetical protein
MTPKQLPPPPPSNQGGDPHRALFEWAEHVLEEAGLLQLLRNAKTRAELESH